LKGAPRNDSPKASGGGKRGRLVLVTGILLFLVVVGLVAHFEDGEQFGELLRHAQPFWLLVAVLLQGATYVCAAGVWHRALARQGHHRPLHGLVPLGLVKVFMDHALPSGGLSGTILVTRALRRRGLPARNATATVLGGLIAFYIAYGIAVAGGFVVLWTSGHASRFLIIIAGIFAIVVAVVPAAILWMSRQSSARLPRWLRHFGPARKFLQSMGGRPAAVLRNPRFLIEASALQLAIIVLDAATLQAVLYALGARASPFGVFASFMMASVVATLTLIPSGLGSFDATAIALLRASGVSLAAALGAMVLLRGLTLLLPLIPGFLLARKEAR
jgi:uncharacterized protein (TIRG00374 family)